MQLSQDQSPAALTRIVYASIHDTLITLNYKIDWLGRSSPFNVLRSAFLLFSVALLFRTTKTYAGANN